MTQMIQCRICRGTRPTNGVLCLGCGTPVANAREQPRKRVQVPRTCPACKSRRYRTTEPGRFVCLECSAFYEADDFGFVDDRPDVNAMKKERSR